MASSTAVEAERHANRQTAVIAAIVVAITIAVSFLSKEPRWTAGFGDSFGVLSAAFSGLALAGLWWTIRLQKIELAATREELKEQVATQRRQQFESTFFQSINLLRELLSQVMSPSNAGNLGVLAFVDHANNLNQVEAGRLLSSDIDTNPFEAARLYGIWYVSNGRYVGSYFELLFRVMEMIDQSGLTDRQRYANILNATMNPAEKYLLFITAYRHTHMQNSRHCWSVMP
jgi:hypothetical protein